MGSNAKNNKEYAIYLYYLHYLIQFQNDNKLYDKEIFINFIDDVTKFIIGYDESNRNFKIFKNK